MTAFNSVVYLSLLCNISIHLFDVKYWRSCTSGCPSLRWLGCIIERQLSPVRRVVADNRKPLWRVIQLRPVHYITRAPSIQRPRNRTPPNLTLQLSTSNDDTSDCFLSHDASTSHMYPSLSYSTYVTRLERGFIWHRHPFSSHLSWCSIIGPSLWIIRTMVYTGLLNISGCELENPDRPLYILPPSPQRIFKDDFNIE